MTEWLHERIAPPDAGFAAAARERQRQLTKPPGSLGYLEELGIRLAAMQRTQEPTLARVRIAVFAADHGVAAEGVSAFPQAVTGEMLRNFARGGAAISVLARSQSCELEVVNVGTVTEIESLPRVIDARIGPGTGNIACEPAMTEKQLLASLEVGRMAAARAQTDGAQLFIGAEMGIANTTPATAVACALTGAEAAVLTGPGTGLDARGVAHKTEVVERALARFPHTEPLAVLRELGGFEIVALTGAYLSSAVRGIPVLVDGFIASAAALAATRLNPGLADWLFLAHVSAEPGHRAMLDALGGRALLDLGMRLGEGSGAAVALSILRSAAALHGGMATFADAGVST